LNSRLATTPVSPVLPLMLKFTSVLEVVVLAPFASVEFRNLISFDIR